MSSNGLWLPEPSLRRSAHKLGAIKSADVDQLTLTPEEASEIHPWAVLIWGSDCRARAEKLRKLGWEAKGVDVFESIPDMVEREIKGW